MPCVIFGYDPECWYAKILPVIPRVYHKYAPLSLIERLYGKNDEEETVVEEQPVVQPEQQTTEQPQQQQQSEELPVDGNEGGLAEDGV